MGKKGDYNGLSADQVEESRGRYGENMLTAQKKASMWKLYIDKYNDPIIKILLVAAVISLVLAFIEKDFIETIGIFLAVFFATTVGFYFERDAAKKFDVLTALGEESPVKVIREGRVCEIPRRDVVVGDVVLLAIGDEVPADGILFKAIDLQIDESALTGEPVTSKSVDAAEAGTAYPPNVVLRSTLVMNGSGRMEVTAVGDATEIGKVARHSTEITAVKTPLNMQLDRLAGLISKVGSGVAVAAFAGFLIHDIMTKPVWETDNYLLMAEIVLKYFMMAVTLIVMAVPEGLPMAVTLALALNMRRMLKSNNLVRKLHACETMGAVTVICTDKTGTLTQNKMQVSEMSVEGDKDLLIKAIAINTTADISGSKNIGNPTEAAILVWTAGEGADYERIRRECVMERQLPFSTEHKFMASIARVDGTRYLFVKGAPEIVMGFCDMSKEERVLINRRLYGYQSKAMRTLCFACRRLTDDGMYDIRHPENLTYQGIAAITDPLREEVPEAVMQCRRAGIDVKVVTGDTSATAVEISRHIGVWSDRLPDGAQITGMDFASLSDEEAYQRAPVIRVMSRARPADKQRLVTMLQRRGEVVAVTGDGTNDAPALNHAHVGLSLGSGTSVAKNASDMTLLDDSFASIVKAVQWGRSLYVNIQRFIFFQLVVNVTALLLVLGGAFIGTELPLTITQMLWVNLIMDTFAAMALASLPPETEVMKEKPRRQTDFIINRNMGWAIGCVGLCLFGIMIVMLYYFEHNIKGISVRELTVFFTVFVMLQWWNLFNAKSLGSNRSAFCGFTSDRGLFAVLVMILAGQWLIVTFGGKMFRTEPLDMETWMWIILLTSPVMVIGELMRFVSRMVNKKKIYNA
ncbi:calcium-translocating P-type ATPase, PMCA-type [Xylanibacter muris]|uniref:P-type Ca(2+) transporter n=1 Tax=Xylanibacter muris TaxID=2736290 RepID=A0ABX2AP51_9BACT|nr:calcium-translocating P-type ATPase, PMCA-type [Xylanibacter muris]NPD92535.1 calcium-translocating P-type ATPase, PMCA-type [Xylanibacter muris]